MVTVEELQDELSVALSEWMSAAVQTLSSLPLPRRSKLVFDMVGGGVGMTSNGQEPNWDLAFLQFFLMGQMAPDAEKVSAVIARLAPLLSEQAQGEPQAAAVVSMMVLQPLLKWYLSGRDDIARPAEDDIKQMVRFIVEYLEGRREASLSYLVKLEGVQSIPASPTFISEGIQLRESTYRERVDMAYGDPMMMNMIVMSGFPMSSMNHDTYVAKYVIEVTAELGISPTTVAEVFMFGSRLVGAKSPSYKIIDSIHSNPLFAGSGNSRALPRYEVSPYQLEDASLLDEEGVREIVDMWSDLRSSYESDRIAPIVTRLLSAGTRRQKEDALVDYWIALESMFTMKDEKGEINYRMGIRIARFLEDSLDARKVLRKTVKDAYNARCDVVHGSAPKSIDNPFADTESILRRALLKIVREHADLNYPDLDMV